jgi:signal peptidase I
MVSMSQPTVDMDQQSQPANPQSSRLLGIAREILETVALTLLIFLVVRSLVQNFKVEGSSMEPSLRHNQYLLVAKFVYFSVDGAAIKEFLGPIGDLLPIPSGRVYLFEPPQRGDIVVFRFPNDPSRDFIKRIVGLPGETIEVRNGQVYINGQPLEEPYLRERPSYTFQPVTVPPGHYFVLGDNRNNSSDSHIWGVVPEGNIIGKAWVSYWPPDAIGLVGNYTFSGPAAGPVAATPAYPGPAQAAPPQPTAYPAPASGSGR